jgi:hypothetical protein
MRQIARGPLGGDLQRTEARASMLQRQGPAPIETNGSLSREGEGPRKSPAHHGLQTHRSNVQLFIKMITCLFADHGCASAVENRAGGPSELTVNPPIGKQRPRMYLTNPDRHLFPPSSQRKIP